MKQNLVKKIALFMCTVIMFCALPLNVIAYGTDAAGKNVNDSIAVAQVGGEQQKKDITEVLKVVIEAIKKVAVAIADYLAEQEKLQQEQPEPPKTDANEGNLSKSGIAGYLYDPAEKCFYTASDPWQRIVGYNELFDIFSEVALIDFDTVRFKFDYKKKNWVVQIWKGQYGLLFYGAEIGVYNKPADRKIPHYDAVNDDDRLKMAMDFYEYEKGLFTKAEWKKKFSRPYDYYWWCTGFIPGNRNDEFDKLRVDTRITAKDYDMLSALTKAINKEGIEYKVKGLDIIFTYH